MDRIAIISDIHGNLPALQAVLEDINARQISNIYCLGDLIGKGPSSDIVVDLVQRTCDKVIRGNWDDFVSKPSEFEAVKWHQSKLGPERMMYLSQLPFGIEFYMSGRLIRLFHASPRSEYERIQPWESEERRISLFDGSEHFEREGQADAAGYGDVHNAYVQNFSGKTLFNTGSVGNPLEIPQASYAVLEGRLNSSELTSFGIQLVRVPYDIELAIKQATNESMPDLEAYVLELRTAQYRGKKG
ncbi:protein phosphatase [Paenibacillus cellulosilyticus]|uniref:Protein phosphatase n=1 Tax=Paenibacillus cellulosilyticus TaxID=375489 RepID=A0A2V2YLI8_9BACL|nr:metallophosphoesterase family protein [Paenibacillus cellulosilyticus]PWV94485.1 protein phosphatase [Paenibacillus cellulosilyticus]QKS44997.1 metallophosphoesterase family protein [Paenibacillus cellulosilyticus]